MMDIKEIAEQVSKRIYVEDGLLLSKFISEKFAEALIAEIAKGNEPVAYATTSEDGDMTMLFFDDGEARKYSGDDAPIKLYTIPPTAEQIANETAWQPIETAPKDNAVFLAWRKHATHPLMVRYEPSYDWFANYDGEHVYDLTHWMPLPTPPKRSMEGV